MSCCCFNLDSKEQHGCCFNQQHRVCSNPKKHPWHEDTKTLRWKRLQAKTAILGREAEKSGMLEGQDDKSEIIEGQDDKSGIIEGQDDKSEIIEGQDDKSEIIEGQDDKSEIIKGQGDKSEIIEGPFEMLEISERSMKKDDHEDWDPRVMDATSVQNLICADGSNEAAFMMGTKGFKQPRTLREVPCKFPVLSSGFCWKGPRCPYLHDPAALTSDYLDVGKQVVVSLANLEKPTELIVEAILNCTITAFVNFSEFYVVPKSSHTCLCEHIVGPASYRRKDPNCTNQTVNRDHYCNRSKGATMMAGENPDVKTDVPLTAHDYWEGFDALQRMEAQLNADLNKNSAWRSLQSSVYAQTEMVAVHGESGSWERGEVLNENASNSVGRDIPLCQVRLIDRGPVVSVSASSMCSLPRKYCSSPPLAIKCCLAGIVPIRYTWHKGICKTWSEILCKKQVLIIVRQQPSPETKIVPVLPEKDEDDLSWPIAPYLVDVILTPELSRLGTVNKEYDTNQYLTDILVEQGWAIKESKFPYRPELENRYRSRTLDELLLPRKSSVIHKPYSQEEELTELERLKFIVDIESHVGPPPNLADLPESGPPPNMPMAETAESYGDPPSVESEKGNYDFLTTVMQQLGEKGDPSDCTK